MQKVKTLFYTPFVLTLLFIAGSASLSAAPLVIPQKQAAHFCQLFVSNHRDRLLDSGQNHEPVPMILQACRMIQPDDSLSIEQIFAGYALLADGWQTMRLFPHQENGAVSWYSAIDELPASIGSEHQKYIREVFPRLVSEVQAGHWETVDAYIDRMIQYQCQFGGKKLPARPSSVAIIGLFLLFFASFLGAPGFFRGTPPQTIHDCISKGLDLSVCQKCCTFAPYSIKV